MNVRSYKRFFVQCLNFFNVFMKIALVNMKFHVALKLFMGYPGGDPRGLALLLVCVVTIAAFVFFDR